MTDNKPDLIIFDCDGVLVDSEPLAAQVLSVALGEAGLELSPAATEEAFTGDTMTGVVAKAEKMLGQQLPADFLELVQRRTFDIFRQELTTFPDVADTLEALVAEGQEICVASNGAPEKMRLSLGLTGLLGYFEDRMFSAAQVRRGKPHPDLFLHAAAAFGVAPQRCLVIEDSVRGIEAARGAGMRVFVFAPRRDIALNGFRVDGRLRGMAELRPALISV